MRYYEDKDYNTLNEWRAGYNLQPVPKDVLSRNGFVIDGVCMGFLYSTDSSVAIIEFVTSNPSADKKKKSKALDELVVALCELGENFGYKYIAGTINHHGLLQKIKKLGFVETSNNMYNVFRSL